MVFNKHFRATVLFRCEKHYHLYIQILFCFSTPAALSDFRQRSCRLCFKNFIGFKWTPDKWKNHQKKELEVCHRYTFLKDDYLWNITEDLFLCSSGSATVRWTLLLAAEMITFLYSGHDVNFLSWTIRPLATACVSGLFQMSSTAGWTSQVLLCHNPRRVREDYSGKSKTPQIRFSKRPVTCWCRKVHVQPKQGLEPEHLEPHVAHLPLHFGSLAKVR